MCDPFSDFTQFTAQFALTESVTAHDKHHGGVEASVSGNVPISSGQAAVTLFNELIRM